MADPTAAAITDAIEKYPGLKKTYESGVESHDGREIALLNHIYAHPTLPSLRNNPGAILAAIDDFSTQNEFLINIGADKARILADLMRSEQPKTYVEVGGYLGYSAILAGMTMRDYASAAAVTSGATSSNDYRVWSLELDPLFASIAVNLIALAGLSEWVTVIVGKADATLERLLAEKQLAQIDMLLLDHVEDLYVSEFRSVEALGLLKANALVVADNVLRPGAPSYREFVRKHPRLETWTLKGLIQPGNLPDELDISRVKDN